MSGLPFEPALIFACIAIALAAGVLRGATGFGSALVMAPLLSVLVGPQIAVPVTILLGLAGSVLLFSQYRRSVEFGLVSAMGLTGLLFIVPGVWLLHFVDSEMMRRLIAIVVFAIAASMLLVRNISFQSQSKSVERSSILFASALGGLVMGATGMGGPPVVTYLAGRGGDAERKKANIVVAVGALEAGAICILAIAGYFGQQTLLLAALLFLPFCAGLWLGERWFRWKLLNAYERLVFVTLMITGLVVAVI